MIINIIFCGFAVAGIGMLWRVRFEDSAAFQSTLKQRLPGFIFGVLECSFCFTFWTSLAVCLIFDPLSGWLPPQRIILVPWLTTIIQILFSWMILGAVAIFIRTFSEQLYRLASRVTWMLKK